MTLNGVMFVILRYYYTLTMLDFKVSCVKLIEAIDPHRVRQRI